MAIELERERNEGFERAVRSFPSVGLPLSPIQDFICQHPDAALLDIDTKTQATARVINRYSAIAAKSRDFYGGSIRIFSDLPFDQQAEGMGIVALEMNPRLAEGFSIENQVGRFALFDNLTNSYEEIRQKAMVNHGSAEETRVNNFFIQYLGEPFEGKNGWLPHDMSLADAGPYMTGYRSAIYPLADALFVHRYGIIESLTPTTNQIIGLASLALADADRVAQGMQGQFSREVSDRALPFFHTLYGKITELVLDTYGQDLAASIHLREIASVEESAEIARERVDQRVRENTKNWANKFYAHDLSIIGGPFGVDSYDTRDTDPPKIDYKTEERNIFFTLGLEDYFFRAIYVDKVRDWRGYSGRDRTFDDVYKMTKEMYIFYLEEKPGYFRRSIQRELKEVFNEVQVYLRAQKKEGVDLFDSIEGFLKEQKGKNPEEYKLEVRANSDTSEDPVLALSDNPLVKEIFKQLYTQLLGKNIQRIRGGLERVGIISADYSLELGGPWGIYRAWLCQSAFEAAHQIVYDVLRLI